MSSKRRSLIVRICVLFALSLTSLVVLPRTAFAAYKMRIAATAYDRDAGDPRYVHLWCDSSNMPEEVNVTCVIYRRKAKGTAKWKKIATKHFSYGMEMGMTIYVDKKVKNYPNTKFQYRVDYTVTGNGGKLKSNVAKVITPPRTGYSGSASNGVIKWKKAKGGATGYIVHYHVWEYRGINAFGEKVYRVRVKYATTSSTSIRASGKITDVWVEPYVKQGKYYCACIIDGRKKSLKKLKKSMGAKNYSYYSYD